MSYSPECELCTYFYQCLQNFRDNMNYDNCNSFTRKIDTLS
jgi:predicted nucleic acid-binding Zn ribbon protein